MYPQAIVSIYVYPQAIVSAPYMCTLRLLIKAFDRSLVVGGEASEAPGKQATDTFTSFAKMS